MRGKNKKIPLKFIVISLIALALVFCFVRYTVFFLRSTDYFMVKDVVANQPNIDISYLKGKNILFLDLKQESERLRQNYPSYQKIILIKQFPDRIAAISKNRQPMARLRLNRDFLVDREGVLFSLPNTDEENFPVIIGLGDKITHPREGVSYNFADLNLALEIISQMNKAGISKKYPLKKVAVSEGSQISVFILEGTEIKFAKADISRQLKALVALFNRAKIDPLNVKYIDLRFKEPAVMFNVKK